jgi:prepilin peptidase CpaA
VAFDLRTRRIPNWLTLSITTLGIGLAAAGLTPVSIAGAIGGFGVGLLLMLPGHLVGGTGAGDVKLFAAVATLLGPAGAVIAFLYTAVMGGAVAIIVAIRRGRLETTLQGTATLVMTGGANVAEIERPTANNRFAYAPAIAVGTFAAALGL